MKHLILLALLFTPFYLHAQDKVNDSDVNSSGFALLFSFNGLDNLRLNNYNGGIGLKFYVSEHVSLRMGLQTSIENESIPANPDEDENGKDGSEYRSDYGTSIGTEIRLSSGRVCPYVGAEIGFRRGGYEYLEPETWPKSSTSSVARTKITDSGRYSLDFHLLGGAELFITKNFSLSGEYQFGYQYVSGGKRKYSYDVIQGSPSYASETEEVKNPSTSFFGITAAGMITAAFYF